MPARRVHLAQLVARRIAEIRSASGLTQEEFAARLDIATKNVQRLESGRQNLTLRTIERVAEALRVDGLALLATVVAERPLSEVRRSALALLVDAGFLVVPAAQPKQKPVHAVPIVDLLAAAGSFRGEPRAVETIGWTTLRRRSAPPTGYFVAQISGASMAPRVPDGSVCLFGPARSPIEGRIALVEHHGFASADFGGPYALKKVTKLTRTRDGRTHVVLRSLNPSYPSIELHTTEDGELRVLAELLDVLASAG
jgi:HTH-type transcriptional regulator/antitoxin HipB